MRVRSKSRLALKQRVKASVPSTIKKAEEKQGLLAICRMVDNNPWLKRRLVQVEHLRRSQRLFRSFQTFQTEYIDMAIELTPLIIVDWHPVHHFSIDITSLIVDWNLETSTPLLNFLPDFVHDGAVPTKVVCSLRCTITTHTHTHTPTRTRTRTRTRTHVLMVPSPRCQIITHLGKFKTVNW